jgi:outer membrane protein TolC
MKTSHRLAMSLALAAAAALTAAPARARTLDRRGAIKTALAQNPQIAAARAEEAAVRAQRRQVDAARWPIVTLDAGVAPSLQATLVPGTAAQSAEEQYRGLKLSDVSMAFLGELTVIQPIYTFGKISWRGEAADHGLRARQAQTRMQRSDIALEVARIYEGYLLARDAGRFLDETIHWIGSTLEGAQQKVEQSVGSVTERDVLRLQAALGLAWMGMHQAEAGMAQARAGLVAYLDLRPDEPLTFAEAELRPVGALPPDLASLVTTANLRRPEIAALHEGQDALNALAHAEAAGLAPDVFIMAFVSAAYTPGRDWLQTRFVVDPLNHFTPGALIGLRWQFQGDMAAARAQEQTAHAEALKRIGEWAHDGIPAEIRRAYEDASRARRDIDQGTTAVVHAKQWMVQASADYAVGFLDIREVSDAVEAYVTLRTAVLKARFDHNVAMAALSKAIGTLDAGDDAFYLAPATPEGTR